LYGDLAGTVERLAGSTPEAAAVAVEWSDLEPRQGYRHTGGWEPSDLADIVVSSKQPFGADARPLLAGTGRFVATSNIFISLLSDHLVALSLGSDSPRGSKTIPESSTSAAKQP